MSQDLEKKIKQLIKHHFPWEELGQSRPRSLQEQRKFVLLWLGKKIEDYHVYATELIRYIEKVLSPLKEKLDQEGKKRLFYRIDVKNITKSPEGVLEKMARAWSEEEEPPPINFHNLQELSDLGRFRIVVNFLDDLDKVRSALEAPYKGSRPSQGASLRLFQSYQLEQNQFKDEINKHPSTRKKGERCLKGKFIYKKNGDLTRTSIEVQIMTMLQEAWDKKDHSLIYEPRRTGRKVAPQHEREMYAMSELLYIADLTFNRLNQEISESQPSPSKGKK